MEDESLPALFGRLGGDLTKLIETHLSLLKVEVKEEVSAYAAGAAKLVAAGVVAALGLVLVNMALAFAVSTVFDEDRWSEPARYAMGFSVMGVVYFLVGAAAIVMVKHRLARRRAVPGRSLRELEKDKEWIKKEL